MCYVGCEIKYLGWPPTLRLMYPSSEGPVYETLDLADRHEEVEALLDFLQFGSLHWEKTEKHIDALFIGGWRCDIP